MAYNNTRSGGHWNSGGGPRNGQGGYGNQGGYGGQRNNDPVHYEIVEHLGVLSVKDNGRRKEVNCVAWNGNPPKIDIREWAPGYESMSRGITLHEIEAARLANILCERYSRGNIVSEEKAGVQRPVHAAPRDMQMTGGGSFSEDERNIPFMNDRAEPLPEDSPGELYEEPDGSGEEGLTADEKEAGEMA